MDKIQASVVQASLESVQQHRLVRKWLKNAEYGYLSNLG